MSGLPCDTRATVAPAPESRTRPQLLAPRLTPGPRVTLVTIVLHPHLPAPDSQSSLVESETAMLCAEARSRKASRVMSRRQAPTAGFTALACLSPGIDVDGAVAAKCSGPS